MGNQHCDTCRFATENGGCVRGVCGTVRSELRGRGIPVRTGGLRALTPEPMTPDGLIGFQVGAYEYPPTVAGYKDAVAQYKRLEQYSAAELGPMVRYDKTLPAGPVWVWQGTELVPITLWQPKGATA